MNTPLASVSFIDGVTRPVFLDADGAASTFWTMTGTQPTEAGITLTSP